MASEEFERTNLSWQLQQLQQRIGEWIELQLSKFQPNLPNIPNLPNVSIPEWLPKVIFWLIVCVLVTAIVWQLWQLFGNSLNSFPSLTWNSSKPTASDVNTVQASEWMRRSQIYYRQGNYREACRALYMGMLQRLNDTGIAPHQPSRTDGEYKNLTEDLPQQPSYQTLLTTHEQLCYGNAELSAEDFEQCQQAYREL